MNAACHPQEAACDSLCRVLGFGVRSGLLALEWPLRWNQADLLRFLFLISLKNTPFYNFISFKSFMVWCFYSVIYCNYTPHYYFSLPLKIVALTRVMSTERWLITGWNLLLLYIYQRHNGSNSKCVIGGAIAHPSPHILSPASRPALGAQPEQQRDDRRSYIKFCELENVSVTRSNPLKNPLIKKFNRRLNHIIQSVCFSFQIHSSIAIRPVGPGRAVLHSQPHTYSTHTITHTPNSFLLLSFLFGLYFICFILFTLSFFRVCVFSFRLSSSPVSTSPCWVWGLWWWAHVQDYQKLVREQIVFLLLISPLFFLSPIMQWSVSAWGSVLGVGLLGLAAVNNPCADCAHLNWGCLSLNLFGG